MAKTKEQKQQMLQSYANNLSNAGAVILVEPSGLNAVEVNELKQQLMAAGASFQVVKNTIFSLALSQQQYPELATLAVGSHAAIFVSADIAAAARVLRDFMKRYKDKLQLKAGIMDKQELSQDQVQALAEMPSKEQSISMIAGLLNQSLAGVTNVLEDSVRSVAIIINQAFEQKQ